MDDAGRRVLMGVATSPFRLQVYDLVTAEVFQVTNGENVDSLQTAISGDGRRVVYVGRAADLPDDAPSQIYLYDLDSGARELISAAPDGEPANQPVRGPTINYDGSVVAFMSDATNLVDFQGSSILARYVEENRTELVSFDSTGQPIIGGNYLEWPSISDDGTRIAFRANGFNLPGRLDAIRNYPQAYVVDLPSRQVILASRNDAGVGARYGSSVAYCEEEGSLVLCSPKLNLSPKISGNGRVVGFHSFGTNLIPNDTNGNASDVYVRDLGAESVGTPAPSPVPLAPALPWVLGALFIALACAFRRTA
jgi:Tol biopolymer transport system component